MLKKIIDRLFFSGPWISAEPIENDDEKIFGTLANDIARKTGKYPGFIKKELDKMIASGNSLAIKYNTLAKGSGYYYFGSEFKDLCESVEHRLDIQFRQPK